MAEQTHPTQQIKPAPTIEQLLDVLEKLSPQELMVFEEKFFEMKQRRIASLTDEEFLRRQIVYRFPEKKRRRVQTLLSKGNAGVITQAEKHELDALVEEFDQKSLEKAEAMSLLAQRKRNRSGGLGGRGSRRALTSVRREPHPPRYRLHLDLSSFWT